MTLGLGVISPTFQGFSFSALRGRKQLVYLFKGNLSLSQDYRKISQKFRKIMYVFQGLTLRPGESFQSFTDSLDTPLSAIRKLGREVYEKRQIWKGLPQRVEMCRLPHSYSFSSCSRRYFRMPYVAIGAPISSPYPVIERVTPVAPRSMALSSSFIPSISEEKFSVYSCEVES